MKIRRLITLLRALRLSPWRSAARGGSIRSGPRRAARRWITRPWWSIARAACCGPTRRREGRWRLPATLEQVDPRYVDMLLAYEDRRFRSHPGVDPLAMARAALQFVTSGRIVSGGSTITMQVARLLEPRTERTLRRQAAADGARHRARASADQGRGAGALSQPRALWRQSRRHPRRLARLFRQGAAPAFDGRGGAAGGVAAVAGAAPAGPLGRGRARRARPRARPHRLGGTHSRRRGRARQARRRARMAAGRCRRWRRMPPNRRSRRRRCGKSIA